MGYLALAGDMMADAVSGGTSYARFNNANSKLGVGDSATAFNSAQTGLQAATNKFEQAVDATFPTRATNVLTYQATFATGSANFTWNEWGIMNGTQYLNRKVENLGTKTSAATWRLTVTTAFNV